MKQNQQTRTNRSKTQFISTKRRTTASQHRVHTLIFNSEGKVLLQQMADHRKQHYLRWCSSVSGDLLQGESEAACAKRSIRQELGVDIAATDIHALGECQASQEDGGVAVFQAHTEGPFLPATAHIRQIAWFGLDQLAELPVTPTTQKVLAHFNQH